MGSEMCIRDSPPPPPPLPMCRPSSSPPPGCVLRGHRAEVTALSLSLSPPGAPLKLASGGSDGELRLWSLHTQRATSVVEAHPGYPLLAIHALNGGVLMTQGRDGFVRTWDLAAGRREPLMECSATTFSFCQAVPVPARDGEPAVESADGPPLIAMPSADAQSVVFWDSRQAGVARTFLPTVTRERAGMCMCLRFIGPDAFLSGWEDGTLQLFDVRATSRPCVRQVHSEPLLCIDVCPKGKAAVTGSADCKVCVIPLLAPTPCEDGVEQAGAGANIALGEPTAREIPVTNESSGSGGIAAVRVRADGRVVATGGWDRRVRVWQWRRMKPLAILRHHKSTVNALDFSPCGRWLASGSSDGTIALWEGLFC